jgi:hypothetical protein
MESGEMSSFQIGFRECLKGGNLNALEKFTEADHRPIQSL